MDHTDFRYFHFFWKIPVLKIRLQICESGVDMKEETALIGLEHSPSSPQAPLFPKDLMIVVISSSVVGARNTELCKGYPT